MAYGCGYAGGYADEGCEQATFCIAGYGMGPFGIEVYEGGISCLEEGGQGGDEPNSNVQDFKETTGRLGCGEPTVFITQRCGAGISCVLDHISNLKWDRRLDDVSEAQVIIDLGGDAKATCCECLADVEPWCHELHIWRDGEEVWVGPIIDITYTYRRIEVRAKDSLGWLSVRIPPIDINYTAVDTDLTTIAEFVLTTAFAEDTVTCELDNIYSQPSGVVGKRFFERFQMTALEILDDLANTGLDYTTLGRTIVLVGDSLSLTPLILLNDEHIMGDIEIKKDGTIQGNRFFVHFEGDGGLPASSTPVDEFCYGPIERLRDGDGLVDGVSAGDVADIYVAASAIAPRIVEIAAGSRLSPETPWVINDMVPGARVDVAIVRTCFQLTQSFRLTGVQVEYTANGESVGVTLSPINNPSE